MRIFRAILRSRQNAEHAQPDRPGSCAWAIGAVCPDAPRAGTSRGGATDAATGDQSGLAGGSGGANDANSPAACTILPATIVSADSRLLILSSGTEK